MIKAICFDLDGVYFTPEGKLGFIESLKGLGISKEDVSFILNKSPQMSEYVRGKISEDSFWDFVRTYLNKGISNEELAQLVVRDYQIDSGVQGVVQKARVMGYKTCICSNNTVNRIRELEKKFHFLGDFDAVVFSYEVGHCKPDKEIFEELIRRVGVLPEEIVYSDDNPERLHGATDLGIQAFVYENFDQYKHKLFKMGIAIE